MKHVRYLGFLFFVIFGISILSQEEVTESSPTKPDLGVVVNAGRAENALKNLVNEHLRQLDRTFIFTAILIEEYKSTFSSLTTDVLIDSFVDLPEAIMGFVNIDNLSSQALAKMAEYDAKVDSFYKLWDANETVSRAAVHSQAKTEIQTNGQMNFDDEPDTYMEAYYRLEYAAADYNAKATAWNNYAQEHAPNEILSLQVIYMPLQPILMRIGCFGGGCKMWYHYFSAAKNDHRVPCGTAQHVKEAARELLKLLRLPTPPVFSPPIPGLEGVNLSDELVIIPILEQFILGTRSADQGCGRLYYFCVADQFDEHEIRTCTKIRKMKISSMPLKYRSGFCNIDYRRCMNKVIDHDESNPLVLPGAHSDTDTSGEAFVNTEESGTPETATTPVSTTNTTCGYNSTWGVDGCSQSYNSNTPGDHETIMWCSPCGIYFKRCYPGTCVSGDGHSTAYGIELPSGVDLTPNCTDCTDRSPSCTNASIH